MQPQTLPLALHHALTKKHHMQGLNGSGMVRKWMQMVHMGMALMAWSLQVRMARPQARTVQGVWAQGVPMQTEGGHGVRMQVQRA